MDYTQNFMSMFEQSLGIREPWHVDQALFNEQDRAVHLYVKFRKTALYACPICGDMSRRYDNEDEERIWRHGDVLFYPCYVHCLRPRVKCDRHGVHVVTPPWARAQSGFTLLFEANAMFLLANMPASKVGESMRCGHTAITGILRHWVEKAVAEDDLSQVQTLCIDETSHRKGQRYVTVVVDAQEKRVIDVEPGRGAEAVEAFATKLEEKGGSCDAIRFVASDMSAAYLKGREDWFPQAESVIDRFHVKKLVLEGMEQVRRAELGIGKYNRAMANQKKLLMIPSGRLTAPQAERVEAMSRKYPKTGRAYRMVEALDSIYRSLELQTAQRRMDELISWMRRSRLEPMKRAALTLKRHREQILGYFRNRLTNALAEGINSLIQAAKRKARGYPTFRGFACMIYLVTGKLKLSCGSPFPV